MAKPSTPAMPRNRATKYYVRTALVSAPAAPPAPPAVTFLEPDRRRPPRPGTRPRLPLANPPRLGRRKQSPPRQRYAHLAGCACLGGSAGAGEVGKVVFPPVMKLVRGSL